MEKLEKLISSSKPPFKCKKLLDRTVNSALFYMRTAGGNYPFLWTPKATYVDTAAQFIRKLAGINYNGLWAMN